MLAFSARTSWPLSASFSTQQESSVADDDSRPRPVWWVALRLVGVGLRAAVPLELREE